MVIIYLVWKALYKKKRNAALLDLLLPELITLWFKNTKKIVYPNQHIIRITRNHKTTRMNDFTPDYL